MPNRLFRQAQYIAFTNTFTLTPSESKFLLFGDVRKCYVSFEDYYPVGMPAWFFDTKTSETSVFSGAEDYHLFGMLIPDRYWNSSEYRFGFGNHEKIDEMKGEGNWYDFGGFGYDSRVVQRPAPDPLKAKYPSLSPYVAFGNNPMFFVDTDGNEIVTTREI